MGLSLLGQLRYPVFSLIARQRSNVAAVGDGAEILRAAGISEVAISLDYGQTYEALVEFTDFVIDRENDAVMSLESAGFTKLINGYQITYTAGYEAIPQDLKLAIMDLVTYYVKNDMAVHSPKAPGTNAVQVEYITTSALPAHIRRVLDMYKGTWD